MNKESYVVNLHILEQCNYKCKYCFSHFNSKSLLSIEEWKEIVDNIALNIPVKRFNIAGGEPLLYPRIDELIEYIKSKDIDVSIITNGILLNEYFIEKHSKNLETIGLSMDSLSEDILMNLNCKTVKNEMLTKEKLFDIAKKIKDFNIKLKINTVVTKENYKEVLYNDLAGLNVDRWKILKMKPFKSNNFSNYDLDITEEEFKYFLENNNKLDNIVVEESMVNSYIVIDSEGYLLDNSCNENYKRVAYAKSENFREEFFNFNLDKELYNNRYKEEI